MQREPRIIEADKIGSATSPLGLSKTIAVLPASDSPRAGDVVVLRQSQEYVEGEIITVLGDGRYKVRWLTGSDYQGRVTTVTTEDVRKKS